MLNHIQGQIMSFTYNGKRGINAWNDLSLGLEKSIVLLQAVTRGIQLGHIIFKRRKIWSADVAKLKHGYKNFSKL